MTPVVYPASTFVLRRAVKSSRKPPQKPLQGLGLHPAPKKRTQRLTRAYTGHSACCPHDIRRRGYLEEVFQSGYLMRLQHFPVQEQAEHCGAIFGIDSCLSIFCESSLFVSETAALFIAEEKHHCRFIHGRVVVLVPTVENVVLGVQCAPD